MTLLFASFGIYHDLGVPLAIGIAVMLVAGITLLPALLAILGRAVFWPAKIVPGEVNESWWGKVAQRVIARPAHTLAVGLVVFGALAFGALLYSPAGFGGATDAPNGSDAAAGNAALDEVLPPGELEPDQPHLEACRPRVEGPRRGRESREGASSHGTVQRAARAARSCRYVDPAGDSTCSCTRAR